MAIAVTPTTIVAISSTSTSRNMQQGDPSIRSAVYRGVRAGFAGDPIDESGKPVSCAPMCICRSRQGKVQRVRSRRHKDRSGKNCSPPSCRNRRISNKSCRSLEAIKPDVVCPETVKNAGLCVCREPQGHEAQPH